MLHSSATFTLADVTENAANPAGTVVPDLLASAAPADAISELDPNVNLGIAVATERGLIRFKLEPPVSQLLVRVVRVVVLGLFAIIALQNLGVELLPLIAGLGVAGAGVALAAQGVLGNVRHLQQPRLVEMPGQNLHADRQALLALAARN